MPTRSPAIFLKGDTNTSVFLGILRNFYGQLFEKHLRVAASALCGIGLMKMIKMRLTWHLARSLICCWCWTSDDEGFRSGRPEVFCKKGVLRNFAKNSQENTCARVYFLIKLQVWAFFYRRPLMATSASLNRKVCFINFLLLSWKVDLLIRERQRKREVERVSMFYTLYDIFEQ